MANVYLQDSTLTAIGDAIRAKAGNSNLLLPSEMPAAITNLPSGGGDVNEFKQQYALMQRVSANSQAAIAEAGLFTSSAKGFTLSIDFAALGYDSGRDFYERGIVMKWVAQNHTNSSIRLYSSSQFLCSPMFGLIDNLYLPVMEIYATQSKSSSGTAQGNPALTINGIINRPYFSINIDTGVTYDMSSSFALGGVCYVCNNPAYAQKQLILADATVQALGRLK